MFKFRYLAVIVLAISSNAFAIDHGSKAHQRLDDLEYVEVLKLARSVDKTICLGDLAIPFKCWNCPYCLQQRRTYAKKLLAVGPLNKLLSRLYGNRNLGPVLLLDFRESVKYETRTQLADKLREPNYRYTQDDCNLLNSIRTGALSATDLIMKLPPDHLFKSEGPWWKDGRDWEAKVVELSGGKGRTYFPGTSQKRIDYRNDLLIEIKKENNKSIHFLSGSSIIDQDIANKAAAAVKLSVDTADFQTLITIALDSIKAKQKSKCENDRCIKIIVSATQGTTVIDDFPVMSHDADNAKAFIILPLHSTKRKKKTFNPLEKYTLDIRIEDVTNPLHPRSLGHWSFEVRRLGANQPSLLISGMWIKRMGGAPFNETQDNEKPSQFELAPTLSYNVAIFHRGNFLRFLRPTIGAGISLLDFRDDIKSEVGAGLNFGLFNGLFRITWGANLAIGGKGKQYWGIGIGIKDISDFLDKDSKK